MAVLVVSNENCASVEQPDPQTADDVAGATAPTSNDCFDDNGQQICEEDLSPDLTGKLLTVRHKKDALPPEDELKFSSDDEK